MAERLSELRNTLISGMRMSMQRSLERRAPAKTSLPLLQKARAGLREFVNTHPENADAWRLLSQAEECFLNYRQAVHCLEKVLSLASPRNKRDLKRLALLKESLSGWESLSLSPDQLRALGEFLVEQGAEEEMRGRSLEFTKKWLHHNRISNPEHVIEQLANRGGHTDFTVLYNVVRG